MATVSIDKNFEIKNNKNLKPLLDKSKVQKKYKKQSNINIKVK